MPRKKRQPAAKMKKQDFTDDHGWTHVGRGGPAREIIFQDGKRQNTSPPPGVTLDKVSDRYHQKLEAWKGSGCFKNLSAIFENVIFRNENVEITRCVCLALGSFTDPLGSVENSQWQLPALMAILEVLGTMTKLIL